MKALSKIDGLILSVHQDIADKMQEAVGINNFMLARWMLLHFVVCSVLLSVLVGVSFFILDLLMLIVGIIVILKGERSIKVSRSMGFRNKLAIEEDAVGYRLVLLFMVLLFIVLYPINRQAGHIFKLLFIAKFACVLLSAYFAACTPKPPSKSDLKKLLEAMGRGIRKLLPRPAEPVPA